MSETVLNYQGRVDENDKLHIVHRKRFDADLKVFRNQDVDLTIKKKRKRRSNPLNRYYFGVMVTMIVDGLKEMGAKVKLSEHDMWMFEIIQFLNSDMAHDYLKNRFIDKVKVDEDTGELVKTEISTKDMTNIQFIEYYSPIYDWARDFLGIQIPLPNENFET